ncbi:Hypothetical predicted protein [Paramuricea clavata]|nr:Hypothetical predicted protein [Paramuricea clavata]
MFGVLLGTLQKFKENSSKEAARERKRKQIDKKLEEAAIQEREQAIRRKKELFVARREKQTKVEELERKIEIAEMLEEWEDHDRKLSKYIRTNTKPHIFYIPAKHNDYTRGLLEKTEEHVEDAIRKRRHEISEILNKPEDDARDEDEREPGNDSMVHGDDREPDVKQGVDHSDDEGNSKSRREVVFKGGRRKVILTSKRRRSESKDDEIGETNEEGNSRKVKDDEGTVEGNEGNEMEMKSEEVREEKVDRKVEAEEKQEEREGGVEMSEVNETKVKDEEKEVEGKEMEETKVETQEMPEEQRIQEEVTGGIGVNMESEGEPTKDGDNSAVTAEEAEDAPAGSEKVVKSMDSVEQTADVQETKNQPKDGGEENETESKMQVDPGQDNDE